MWGWIIGISLAVVALVMIWQYRAQAGVYQPLSSRRPDPVQDTGPELGLEAIDLSKIARTNRQNEALERSQLGWGRRDQNSATYVKPYADDETYAARFHSAYMKKQGSDK